MSNGFKGFFYGIVTSVTFGLIPLFTLPVMHKGIAFDSILFYRFLIASVVLGIMVKMDGESLKISWKDCKILILLAFFYTCSAMFLFWGYDFMGAGVATTIHFTYPVWVTILMFIFFRERASWVTWLAIVMAVGGVARLSLKGAALTLDGIGVVIVLMSAVAYGSYIVTVNKSGMKKMNSRKLTFYVFLFSTMMFAMKASTTSHGIQVIPDVMSWMNLVLLAILPTVVSNIALLLAVRHIGGTKTSILGAMEPLTAVLIGVSVFGEAFSWQELWGIVLILGAVTLIILSKPIRDAFSAIKAKI